MAPEPLADLLIVRLRRAHASSAAERSALNRAPFPLSDQSTVAREPFRRSADRLAVLGDPFAGLLIGWLWLGDPFAGLLIGWLWFEDCSVGLLIGWLWLVDLSWSA
ncbi:hypothetical protein Ait01nite_031390 [Actinoplanes italicus]|nr:hypothetical protein Ait01nite_031390 [Actinoplanes italicus]